jgi:hypothetical protein
MTSRLKILIPSAAFAALSAVASADVALAQQGCFMDCNRAPDKPVATSSDLTSPDRTGAMKKPTIRRHTRNAHFKRARQVAKP